MPSVKSIKKTMQEKAIPADTLSQFNFPKSQGNQPLEVISLIDQMDNLLTQEQRVTIMEEQGCHKTGHLDRINKQFAETHKGKSLEDRILLLRNSNVEPNVPCHLNDDGTISIYWGIGEKDNYQCVCKCIRRLKKEQPEIQDISKTFCGCCGGHIKYHYSNVLGVKLKLKEIVSSPLSSNGKNHCEFLFDIAAE